MKRKVEIIIDELVLHGFNPADRYAIGEALSAELERLVAGDPGANLLGHNVDTLSAKPVNLAQNTRPEKTGAQVAQAVHGSITK
jgi:hypothetical protein